MNFLIKVNLSKQNSRQVMQDVIKLLKEENHRYKICDDEYTCLLSEKDKAVSIDDGMEWCDIVITVGGDGTMLSVGQKAADAGKPIVGINTGRIGFLTAIEGGDIQLLKQLSDENVFTVKKHHFLKARINQSPWKYCLNDLVISKSNISNTVDLSIYSNDNLLSYFAGDGIILATSTGSTAYSLSVGGPIVDSDLEAMIISPVAPHTLNRTSMVFAKDKHISIKANDRNHNQPIVAFDGADYTQISREDTVQVRLSSKYVSIYTLCNRGQFEKVDKKLKSR